MTQSLSEPKQPTPAPTPVPNPAPTAPKVDRKSKSRLLLPIGLLLAGIIGGTTWFISSRPKVGPLSVTGRIEGYETDVGAKTGGRVNLISVREGDAVRKGDVIVKIDDAEIQAQLGGAEARINAAREQERQALLQISVVQSQIQEAQLNLQQAQGDQQFSF